MNQNKNMQLKQACLLVAGVLLCLNLQARSGVMEAELDRPLTTDRDLVIDGNRIECKGRRCTSVNPIRGNLNDLCAHLRTQVGAVKNCGGSKPTQETPITIHVPAFTMTGQPMQPIVVRVPTFTMTGMHQARQRQTAPRSTTKQPGGVRPLKKH